MVKKKCNKLHFFSLNRYGRERLPAFALPARKEGEGWGDLSTAEGLGGGLKTP